MLKLVPEILTNEDSLMEADMRRNLTQGEISSDLYRLLVCDIEKSKLLSF